MPAPVDGAGLARWARAAEDAGFASLWVSDHLLLPTQSLSRYPFRADGRVDWAMDGDWFDPAVMLGAAASATERVVLGTAVLIAPIRQPYVVSRQFASLDRLYPGRFVLGVGAGWLAEEFVALGVDFAARGALTDDWIRAVRTAWTGSVPAGVNRSYPVPVPMHSRPGPAGEIPIVVGGSSRAALRRAATLGDGWMAHEALPDLDVQALADAVHELRECAPGRTPRILLRLVRTEDEPARVADLLPALAEIGVDDVIVDAQPDPAALTDTASRMRAALVRPPVRRRPGRRRQSTEGTAMTVDLMDQTGVTDLADTSAFDDDQLAIWNEQKAIYAGFLSGRPERVDHRIAHEATIWDWESVRIANGHDAFSIVRANRPRGENVAKAQFMVTEDPIITIFGDVALARHLVTCTYRNPDGTGVAKTMRCTLQWQRRDGEWWIVHSHEDVIREQSTELPA
ncbi:MAG: TIGR03619 family F420-dependent LLM class oxidoreductase [Microbacterium sp.]